MSTQSGPPPPPPPPGWYPDASRGGQRYWTGTSWGVHESEMPPPPPQHGPPAARAVAAATSAPPTIGPEPKDNTVSAGYALAILVSSVGLIVGVYLLATGRPNGGIGVMVMAVTVMSLLTLVSLGVVPA